MLLARSGMAPHGLLFPAFFKENHHGSHTAPEKSVAPIVVPCQLTLRTIRGKNGPFTVGRLATHLGNVWRSKTRNWSSALEGNTTGVCDPLHLSEVLPGRGRHVVRDPRQLDGMTLNGIDKLERDEARSFATQDVDPLDEEQGRSLSRQRRPSPPRHPGSPSPHPCRRPGPAGRYHALSAWDAPLPARGRCPGSTEDGDAALFRACCGRWASP